MNKFLTIAAGVLAAATVSQAALADGGAKFLGNITTSSEIRSDMGTYWNQLTNENGCKWGTIHSVDESGNSVFNFNGFDSCENGYKWAKAAPGRTFKFHALIWGSQKPDFLCTKKNPGINKEKTLRYITEWFDAVAKQFPDLEYIDVVNEAIWACDWTGTDCNYHSGYSKPAQGAEGISTDDPECGGTYIVQALGGDDVVNGKHQYNFVKKAFEMARERWPQAKLIYNDYNTLTHQMNEGIEMVKTLVENGAPIDFYGQQAHDCKGMSKSDFETKLTRIHNETGLPLLISEYDIGEADGTKQKNDYANQIPFMWETPWIGGITIWGYINGATWAANTGIMESDGTKRPAFTWLEEYFKNNLSKGQIDISISAIEPVPQEPYGNEGKAWPIPGKIEAENFDQPGIGTNNNSYYDTDSDNNACLESNTAYAADCKDNYRSDVGVDIKTSGTGHVIGWGATGEWLEYTVDVKEAGDYSLFVAASSGNGGIYKVSVVEEDGTVADLTDEITVVAGTNADDYNSFAKSSYNVKFMKAGKQIVRFTIVQGYTDIDYMTFVAGANAVDPEPIGESAASSAAADPTSSDAAVDPASSVATADPSSSATTADPASSAATADPASSATVANPASSASNIGSTAINKDVHYEGNVLQDYDIFDMQGSFMGRLSAYSMRQAVGYVGMGTSVKVQGVYYVRNRTTGQMQTVRVVK